MIIYVLLLKLIQLGKFQIIVAIVILGLCHNTIQVLTNYINPSVANYQNYVSQQQKQVDELKNLDDGIFRVNQTKTYDTQSNRITANYNEGFAYDYNSIVSYTSSPLNNELYFMDKLGYKKNGDNINVVNLPIIASDSLLGVKYIFSDISIENLQLIQNSNVYNDKSIYLNEFALPLAFICKDIDLKIQYEGNPFEYVNQIYSKLFGEDVEVYQPVSYEEIFSDQHHRQYKLSHVTGTIYGNIPTDNYYNAEVTINRLTFATSQWLGLSVFYVPVESDETIVNFTAENEIQETIYPQFYALNAEVLSDLSKKAHDKQAEFVIFDDTRIKIEVDGKSGDKLFTSIPYNRGWNVICNGNEIQPKLIDNYLICFDLQDGKNTIEMIYSLPSLKIGILISVLSFTLLMKKFLTM